MKPDRVLDDRRREAMSTVGELIHAGSLPCRATRSNPVSVTLPPSVWGRVSFGLGFLLIAFLVWRSGRFIVGDFSPPIMDAFARRHVDPDRRKTPADEH